MNKTALFITTLIITSNYFNCDGQQQHLPQSSQPQGKNSSIILARHGRYGGGHHGGYYHGGYRRGGYGGIGFGFGLGYPGYGSYDYPYYRYRSPIIIERESKVPQDTWDITNTTSYPIDIVAGNQTISIAPNQKQIIRQTSDRLLIIRSPHSKKTYKTKKPYIIISDFDDNELDINAYYNEPDVESNN